MMKASTRSKGQVYSIGNYLMSGRVLGKGHFARVEEATHRVIGKKVAIKIIDLTCIKEEYARRNLHREPRVMAKLRHPCIAALYETMMHGPRLYVVMEAAGGGDLCTHVLSARGAQRGLPEARARHLAAQLVSAVRHMHARGVVHRDLKMENIMLDSTKQFIKIVDFGLSNIWMAGAALRTPCGSLEYAAPELFVDGRRYGPEVDLWSIGVIVYGMVTGGLPFAGGDSGEGRSRPQLRAAIAKGFTRKQRAALAFVSNECSTFVQHLLEPDVQLRMKIEEAAKHRWVKRPGMRMKTHPLPPLDPKVNREMYRQISELMCQPVMDVVAQIKAEPFGPIAGIYNIKTHLLQLQATPGVDLLWSSTATEVPPASPPEYRGSGFDARPDTAPCTTKAPPATPPSAQHKLVYTSPKIRDGPRGQTEIGQASRIPSGRTQRFSTSSSTPQRSTTIPTRAQTEPRDVRQKPITQLSQISAYRTGSYKKPHKIYDSGDCGLDPRLPCIDEHSSTDVSRGVKKRAQCVRKVTLEEERRLHSCPNRMGDGARTDFYRRAEGCLSWRTGRPILTPPKILLQNTATSIKRASLGNIVSPQSSTTSQCKSERTTPMAWFSARSTQNREPVLQRLRRTAPMK